MRTAFDVYEILDRIAPFSSAAEWDPVGIQVGDPSRSAEVVGVCHEVTTDVVSESVARGVDVLVAYHPVLFTPTRSLVAGPTPSGRALALAAAGITLIVSHTAFDVARGGTAEALAAALGLEDVEPLGSVESATDPTAPAVPAIGRIGSIEAITLAQFADRVTERLNSLAVRVAGTKGALVSRVAVVPGSGADFVADAIAGRAEVLVTGDVSHHRAVAAVDRGLAVIDAGHIPTERPGIAALFTALENELGESLVDLTTLKADPWA